MSILMGTLPRRPGEIAIPVQWATNQMIQIGDTMDLSYGATPNVKIVGILNAPDMQCAVGIHLEEVTSGYLYPGIQLTENNITEYLSAEEHVVVENYAVRSDLYNQLYHTTFLFGGLLVSFIILVIGIICMNTLIATHLDMRKEEFSFLNAQGWTIKQLIHLFLSEAISYFILAFVLGGLVYIIVGLALKQYFFIPQGISIVWVSGKGSATLAIMAIVSFSTLFLNGRKIIQRGVSIQNMLEGEFA